MKRPRYKEYWNPDLRRDQFIAGWYLSDQLAEAMIESMVKHWDKGQNDEKRGYWRLTSQKNPDKKLEDTYMNHIEQLFELYKIKYPWSVNGSPWSVMRPWSYQCWEPGDHYKAHHFEDGGPRKGHLVRHFTWLTYLNGINENGETEFLHQGIKIQPEKALTVIFPAGWSHTHWGNVTHEKRKYAATGWASYHHRC